MAIMYCPECGKEMSDSLKKCPHCGFKFKKNKETNKKKKLFVTVSIIVIVVCIVGIVGFMQASKLSDEEQTKVTEINTRINNLTQISFSGMEKSEIQSNITNLENLENDYNKLNWKEKIKIKGYNNVSKQIDKADDEIDKVINEQVKALISKIDSIGEISIDSKELLDEIENEYNNIEEDYRKKVTNYSVLKKARQKYNNIAVSETISAINAMGKVELSNEFEKKLEKAKSLYDELSDDCKKQVTNIALLNDSKEKYRDLEGKKDELLSAKDDIKNGNLNEAQKKLKKLPSKFSYKGTTVADLNKKLNKNQKWVGICGKWDNTSGKAETGCESKTFDYRAASWSSTFDKGDYYVEIRCKINDDNTITIIGEANFMIFTDYSTIQAGLDYETKYVSFKKKISSSDMGKSIYIGDHTSITISEKSISAKYDFYSKNEDVSFNYTYVTNVKYGKRTEKY